MKTRYDVVLPTLIAGVALLTAGRLTAQTFTPLHSFTAGGYACVSTDCTHTNSDGVYPAGLILSGNTLYGTASSGGSSGSGAVFKLNTDGTGVTNLHSFATLPHCSTLPCNNANSDGAQPQGGLILLGSTLYGTARLGGSSGNGTIFAINTDGTGFTSLHNFTAASTNSSGVYTNSDGTGPSGLVLSGNTLYGTASSGGSSGNGAIFVINTDGTGFTNLYSFTATSGYYPFTNSDGATPYARLILSGNTLYGTAAYGGPSGNGTVFAVNTDGTVFTNLYNFTPLSAPNYNFGTNSDGANPQAALILSGNTLYGTAAYGGPSGHGTVFGVHTDGTGFTNLHSFTPLFALYYQGYYYRDGTNSAGARPGCLILSGITLYGTASDGGGAGNGTVFAVNTDGTGFTNLHTFTARSEVFRGTNSDGAIPIAGLILSGDTLYGTAADGGSADNGTIFSISFRPQLTITPSGTNVILSWPVSVAGFSSAGFMVQDTADISSPTGWSVPDPFPPVIVNGQYRVTRPMLGPRRSYRLTQ